jgi:hypothetical protein
MTTTMKSGNDGLKVRAHSRPLITRHRLAGCDLNTLQAVAINLLAHCARLHKRSRHSMVYAVLLTRIFLTYPILGFAPSKKAAEHTTTAAKKIHHTRSEPAILMSHVSSHLALNTTFHLSRFHSTTRIELSRRACPVPRPVQARAARIRLTH